MYKEVENRMRNMEGKKHEGVWETQMQNFQVKLLMEGRSMLPYGNVALPTIHCENVIFIGYKEAI